MARQPAPLAHALWDQRLLETDAEALRYRMAASRLRLRRGQVDTLRQRVQACLDAELRALEALEAEALRQHLQQLHALKYGQYLSVLSAHLEAASGSSIGMVKLMPDSEEVRQVLVEVGVPAGAPLQVLHAYRLRNTRLQTEFGRAAVEGTAQGAASTSSGGGGGGGISDPGAAPHSSSGADGYTQRLLALRLPTSAVEHTLVHGLRPRPTDEEDALWWQVDPRTVPEAGCVDMKSLGGLISGSAPPPTPLALFSGKAAWETLLAGAVDEAIAARHAAAAKLIARRRESQRGAAAAAAAAASGETSSGAAPAGAVTTMGAVMGGAAGGGEAGSGAGGAASAGPTGGVPTNKLILLVRVLQPRADADRGERAGGGTAALLGPPGTATAEPKHTLPVYLLHYGTMTSAPPEPASTLPLGVSSGSEKNMAQTEARTSEPRAVRNDSRGGGGGKAGASGRNESSTSKGKASAAAAAASGRNADGNAGGGKAGTNLPLALRATRSTPITLGRARPLPNV